MLKNSLLYLPDTLDKTVPFSGNLINPQIKQKLAYCQGSNPVTFVLKNSVELFIELDDRVIPFSIVREGNFFGTWRFLDIEETHCPQTSIWGMTAGARSIFMLPKISKATGHNKLLNNFHISTDKPKTLLDHWKVFRSLANAPNFGESWNTELLYFTGKWFENRNDKAWATFYHHLLNNAWQGSGYWRNQFIWELLFSIIEKNRNIKPPPYLTKIVKHLLSMATGSTLGFSPAIDDSLAPIKKLQKIYIEEYGLEDYAPVIMQPSAFLSNNPKSRPIYYSLQFPTAPEFSLKSSERTTTLTDLCLLRSLLNKYIREIASSRLNVKETLLYDAAIKVNYDFFHSTTGNYSDIKETKNIPVEDTSFTEAIKHPKAGDFSNKAKFLNGCVRISRKLEKN